MSEKGDWPERPNATEAAGRLGLRGWGEAAVVAVAAFALFTVLSADLPIDDTARYTPSVSAGRFEWDPAHLLMQPATVLWHRFLSFGSSAVQSQKRINAFSAALGLAIFHALLVRLGRRLPVRLCLTALAATSFHVLSLAVSGHMKLTVFPFLAFALLQGVVWEEKQRAEGKQRAGWGNLSACAVSLGLGTAFLANTVVVLPFLALSVLLVGRHWTGEWHAGMKCAGNVLVVSVAVMLVVFVGVYAATTDSPPTVADFLEFLRSTQAAGARGAWVGLTQAISRLAFATVLNFVYTSDLGPLLRAYVAGDIGSLAPYWGTILGEAMLTAGMAGVLLWVYLRGAASVARGVVGAATAWAFLLGTWAFALFWGMAEAEFYFQITLPTLLLAALTPRSRLRAIVLGAWLVASLVANVGGYAIPRRFYPYHRYAQDLRAELSTKDMIVYFAAYPGRHYIGSFFPVLPERRLLKLDILYGEIGQPGPFLEQIREEMDGWLADGGRVLVFGVLDEDDWNAPWPWLIRGGLTKSRLLGFIRENYEVHPLGRPADIPCWELRPTRGRPR